MLTEYENYSDRETEVAEDEPIADDDSDLYYNSTRAKSKLCCTIIVIVTVMAFFLCIAIYVRIHKTRYRKYSGVQFHQNCLTFNVSNSCFKM